MTTSAKRKLNWRAVTSTFIGVCFVFIAMSGIILYFAPPGRIAHWTHWTFSGVSKGGWQAVHTVFALSFIIVAVFHLKHNWKPLISYMKSRVKETSGLRKEMLISTIFGLVMLILTLASVPPFSTIMVWSEDLSQGWGTEDTSPPVPHAEIMTLTELAEVMHSTYSVIAANLNKHEIFPESENVVLVDLASQYNKTPNQLYQLMLSKNQKGEGRRFGRGGGYGQKSISQICSQLNIPLSEAMAALKASGIEAQSDDNLRQLAERYDRQPHDLVSMISDTKP